MKAFIAGVWTLAVALGTTYAVASIGGGAKGGAEAPKTAALQMEKTRVLNVPMIKDGAIHGFVVAKFAYTVDPAKAKTVTMPPEVFLLDEAFREIYTDDHLDFLHLEKYDINKLTAHLLESTNKRLGVPLLHDVLVQDFTYVSKEENDR